MYQLAGPFTLMLMTREGGEGTPLYGLYRYVRLQRVWFFQPFLVMNRVWFLHSIPKLGSFLFCFFGRSYFFIIMDKIINKSLSQVMFTAI